MSGSGVKTMATGVPCTLQQGDKEAEKTYTGLHSDGEEAALPCVFKHEESQALHKEIARGTETVILCESHKV